MSDMAFHFDEEYRIDESMTWGMLKYGFCSYFVLAYTAKYPSEKVMAVMEYDEELKKEYLVHFLVITDNYSFVDAEGAYTDWSESVKNMTDVEFMTLRAREVGKEFVMHSIEEDMGYDDSTYKVIYDFVHRKY